MIRMVVLILTTWLLSACLGTNKQPQLIATAELRYPATAKAAKIEGYVLVEYGINSEGQVVNPKVIKAEPPGVFEEAALAAVARWLFRPMLNSQQLRLSSKIAFSLADGKDYPIKLPR